MGIKISDLPVASQSNTDDIFPVVQDNTTKQIQQSVLLQDVNNDITDLNNNIDRLDNRIDEAIAEFTYPLSYKGEVQTFQDLPSGATAGDIYTVISENKNYIWNGTEWVEYAAAIDFTNIENQIKTTLTTEPAEEHTIQNTAGVNGKIDVSGNSVQSTGIELPEGYTQLEYIESNGTQYIDTGVANSATWELQLKMAWTAQTPPSGDSSIYCANGITSNMQIGIMASSGNWTTNGSNSSTQAILNQIYEVSASQSTKNLVVDGTTVHSRPSINASIISNIILFAYGRNNNTPQGFCSEKIYNAKIYDNGTLVRNFIPCKNASNVIGLYDLVNNTFYGNNGTGTFLYGNIPSPTYPVEIHNVGDNVNLADESILASYKVNEDDECYIFNNSTLRTNNPTSNITFKEKTAYTISYIAKQISGRPRLIIKYTDGTTTNIGDTSSISTELTQYKSISNSNKTIEKISGDYSTADNNSFYIKKNSFIIREGDVDVSTYSPYNCGNTNIEVSNKNLFKNDFATLAYNSVVIGQTTTLVNGANYRGAYAKVEEGQIYSISKKVSPRFIVGFTKVVPAAGVEVLVYATNNNATKIENITIPSGYKYIFICLSTTAVDSSTLEIMIEKNPTATSYIPHQSQLITFPFTEGQRLYKGDYLASDGIHHKRYQEILTENNTITKQTNNLAPFGYYFTISISKTANYKDNDYVGGLKSNLFKIVSNTLPNLNNGCMTMSTTANKICLFVNSSITTVAELKTWLQSNPITVEYELATEEIEPYTPEQEEVYYQLQHTLMYEGLTYVECIDEIKCKTIVEYYYNNELNKTYAGRIDGIDERINNLEQGEIYSTTERRIGTWIDGKPVYRKYISVSLGSSTSLNYDVGVNIDELVSVNGYCQITGSSSPKRPFPFVTMYQGNLQRFAIEQYANNILTFMSAWTYSNAYLTIEYTKTTD